MWQHITLDLLISLPWIVCLLFCIIGFYCSCSTDTDSNTINDTLINHTYDLNLDQHQLIEMASIPPKQNCRCQGKENH